MKNVNLGKKNENENLDAKTITPTTATKGTQNYLWCQHKLHKKREREREKSMKN